MGHNSFLERHGQGWRFRIRLPRAHRETLDDHFALVHRALAGDSRARERLAPVIASGCGPPEAMTMRHVGR